MFLCSLFKNFTLGGRSCDELHARRPKQLAFPARCSKKMSPKSPQLLQTIPTQEITQHTGGMVDSLRQRKVQPSILAAAKRMKRDTCQARARLSLRPVVSGTHAEPGAVLKWTIFVGSTSRLRFTHKRIYWQTRLDVSHWFESRRHLVVWKAWETSQQRKQERCFKSVGSRITWQ